MKSFLFLVGSFGLLAALIAFMPETDDSLRNRAEFIRAQHLLEVERDAKGYIKRDADRTAEIVQDCLSVKPCGDYLAYLIERKNGMKTYGGVPRVPSNFKEAATMTMKLMNDHQKYKAGVEERLEESKRLIMERDYFAELKAGEKVGNVENVAKEGK